MRILIFNWRDIKHPLAGGAEIATFEHAKAWVKKGHQVIWFSSKFKKAKEKEKLEGIEIIRRGEEIITVQLAAFFWYFRNARGKVDLVIDQFHGFPFFTPLYVQEKKLAFIHETAGRVWFLNRFPFPFNYLVGAIGYLIEPWIFRLLYRQIPFLTVSQSTQSDLMKWGIPRQNIAVIHNGVRKPAFQTLPKKKKQPTVIFLGFLEKDKGIRDAILAFKIISQYKEGAQFWVVGKGRPSYVENLKKLVKKLRLVNKIKFFGFVSEKKKFELLAKAHILINPSVKEGWGLVVIEANTVGTPAVVYNVPGLRDSTKNGKTGLICQQNTPQELAENVLKLLDDKKLYQQLQKNALVWSKKFSWQKAGQKSLELINSLIKG